MKTLNVMLLAKHFVVLEIYSKMESFLCLNAVL